MNDPLYGFTYFRQEKDASVRRGFNQVDIVILHFWPIISVQTSEQSIRCRVPSCRGLFSPLPFSQGRERPGP